MQAKCDRVISANTDFDLVRQIGSTLTLKSGCILTDKSASLSQSQLDPNTFACLKYAPLTPVEVERSFSLCQKSDQHSHSKTFKKGLLLCVTMTEFTHFCRAHQFTNTALLKINAYFCQFLYFFLFFLPAYSADF